MNTPEVLDIPSWEVVVAAGRVAPPDPGVVAAAQSAVAAMIREADREPARAGSLFIHGARNLLWRPRWRWGLAGVSVAAAAACGLAVLGTGSAATPTTQAAQGPVTQSAGGVGPREAAFFSGLALIASAQASASPQAWRTELATTQAGAAPQHYTEVFDRSGITLSDGGAQYRKDRLVTWAVGGGSVDWSGLDKLPTDPATLQARFSARGAGVAFDQIGDLLGESPASPALRSALYRVLGQLPGVRMAGQSADTSGRSGSVVEFSVGGMTEQLIVDPRTGSLLEKTRIADQATPADVVCGHAAGGAGHCSPALYAGEVVSRTTYLKSGPAEGAS